MSALKAKSNERPHESIVEATMVGQGRFVKDGLHFGWVEDHDILADDVSQQHVAGQSKGTFE